MNSRCIRIIGGGLAGLSLAMGLRRRGVDVAVCEAGRYPRHRVCGEFISGVSEETLAALAIGEALADARRHVSLSWFFQGRRIFEGRLPVPAWGISRHRLDERLATMLAEAGGVLDTGARAAATPGEGVVMAAGRRYGARGRRIGLKAHVRGPRPGADLEMHAGANGYAGLAGVEDGWINVCGIFTIDRSIRARGHDLLPAYLEAGGNPALARALRDSEWREGSFCAAAGFDPGPQGGVAGEARIGDAAAMIPPFTGNGMTMAFQSAECALDPLDRWACGTLDWRDACRAIDASHARRFRLRMATAVRIERWITRPDAAAALRSLAAAGVLPLRPALALVR